MENKTIDYSKAKKVLSVKNLEVNFKSDHGLVQAVRGVSFDLYKGETLCIVGESGSGKSVTSKSIMGILANNAIINNGQIIYEGEDLVRVSEEDFHRIRGNKIGMIFQDPLSALNPIVKVGKQIIETMMINNNVLKKEYYNLISRDLTNLRNLKANGFYEIHKANNQINENLSTIKEYKSLLTKLENNDANKEELISKKEVLEDKVNSYLSLVVRNYGFDKETYLAKIDKANSKIEKLNKSKEPTTDNIPLELRKERYNLQINDYNAHIELLDKFIIKKFTSNLIDNLTIVNEYLSLLIELTKKGLKNQSPVLKKIFRLSKKNANNIVAFHKLQLLKEHKTKSLELKQKLFHAQKDLLDYKNSLSIEKRNELNSIVRKNKLIKKQIKKEQVTFKENSISKTVQNNLKLVEFSDKKFEKLFLKVEECKNALEDEKNNYINKTRITKKEAKKKALEVMREVGIPLPERRFNQYPFEFSGGMRQRIVIAIALTADPEILICDEPTTALDVTIQAQILELINRLKVERNLSCIFITHDLGVVANMADRVAVMYAGKIVEYGLVEEVFFEPKHPYTWALLSSIPDIDSKEKLEAIPGTPPDMVYPPKGDAFALRSKYALKIDFKYEPPYFEVSPTHYAATWLLHKDAPKVEMPKIVKTRIKNAYKQYEESLKGGK